MECVSKKYPGFLLLKTKVHRAPRASLEAVLFCILPVFYPIPSLLIACLVFCLCSKRNCSFCLGFSLVVTMCNKSHMCQNGQVFSYVRINFSLILIQSVNLYKKEINPFISSVPFSQYSLSFAWAAVMWKQISNASSWKQPFITLIFLYVFVSLI